MCPRDIIRDGISNRAPLDGHPAAGMDLNKTNAAPAARDDQDQLLKSTSDQLPQHSGHTHTTTSIQTKGGGEQRHHNVKDPLGVHLKWRREDHDRDAGTDDSLMDGSAQEDQWNCFKGKHGVWWNGIGCRLVRWVCRVWFGSVGL